MQKIVIDLDRTPEAFERPVSIPDALTGTPLRVRFTFRWRDRVEAAVFFDRFRKAAEDALASQLGSVEASEAAAVARDVEALQQVAAGWNIDAEFNAENITKFFRRFPAAGPVIAREYRTALLGE